MQNHAAIGIPISSNVFENGFVIKSFASCYLVITEKNVHKLFTWNRNLYKTEKIKALKRFMYVDNCISLFNWSSG